MSVEGDVAASSVGPLWGELRYGGELMRLLADGELRASRRHDHAPPVLLIPGFMAGDGSLLLMRHWLRRRGHTVAMSGMRANVDCAERAVTRLQAQVRAFAQRREAAVVVIGQSRGGALARVLARREPDAVAGLVMLGSPVRDGLAVSAPVLRTVRLLARLGDLGLPGVISTSCRNGACCAAFREDLIAPLAPGLRAIAVHSRSDGIVDWRACLDPDAEPVEVDSSHCGMSVHPGVYRALERMLGECEETTWSR
jgi:triacylglycerol lipase